MSQSALDSERGTGRTRAMVMELPCDKRSIVIVHNNVMADYVRRMIYDLRGNDVFKNVRVMAISSPHDVALMESAIWGTRAPVFIDHAFHNAVMNWRVHEMVAEIVEAHRERL